MRRSGMHPCKSCGELIGNRAKSCRHCGTGEPVDHPAGYKRRYLPGHPLAAADGYVLEHRWLLHQMGVAVPEGHHVHHRNGDKADNRWSNLEVLPESVHHRLHIGAAVENQHGRFPVLRDPELRRARARQHCANYRARRAA